MNEMGFESPSIGLAVPTYRRQDQLATLLASVPRGVTVYVSDNGATLDKTFRYQHPQVVFRSNSTVVSMFANWNLAARMAKTDWVLIPSDDDIYYQHSFDAIEAAIRTHASADVIVFGHHVVDEQYRTLSTWKPAELRVFAPPLGFECFKFGVDARMPSIAFRRELLERLDYFDESFILTAADSELVQRAVLCGRSVFIPTVVSGYRTWPNNATSRTTATAEWMIEIDRWGRRLQLALEDIPQYAADAAMIRSELYATNLAAGILHLKREQRWREAWVHFMRSSYPWRAKPKTQARLFYDLFKRRKQRVVR